MMTTMTVTNIFDRLQQKQSAQQLTLINTRVMLATGVNLKNIRPEQDSDFPTVTKVRAELTQMGIAP